MQIRILSKPASRLLAMKLLFLLTVTACLQASAGGYGQTITLDLRNEPLEKALNEIEKQTGYFFIYTRDQLKNTIPINVQAKNIDIKQALDYCFVNQPLSYTIEDKYVIVLDEPDKQAPADKTIDVSGRVVDESGNGLLRITVAAIKSKKNSYTNEKGEFNVKGIVENDVLIFTGVGYRKEEIAVNKQPYHLVIMKQVIGTLDEAVVMAYGKTTKRLNTGSIGKVSSSEIAQQPVSDPLAALHGKVPGLVVTQSNGLPGSTVKIQVRGQNSLTQGSEPLIIVDGVPLAANNQRVNNQVSIISTSLTGGLSPMASINPLDIESIEILKDADATSIYGSRGANGVVLITTKKGAVGKTRVFANVYTGWSKVPKLPQMLNTREYVAMRKEAIANDGFTPTTNPAMQGYAPDILIWDTTRETDFTKMLLGNTAHSYNGQVGFSGGNQNIQFFFSSGYNKDETVFPGNMGSNRISLTNNVNYISDDKKFSASLASSYSSVKNNLNYAFLTTYLSLPPNAPALYTPDGKLNWEEGGYYFDNPVAYERQKYTAITDNLLSNLQIEYKIVKGLSIRSSFGYNAMQVDEKTIIPIAAQIPIYNPKGKLKVSDNSFKSWIIEPQAAYETTIGQGKLSILAGSTFSRNKQNSFSVDAEGYESDNLLNSLSAAPTAYSTNNLSDYRYMAFFGRINYNWRQKYLINISGRRDGSSRFGPDNRFANFGAIGAAWLFQEEKLVGELLPFLSFGKVRTSYGVTGNDQIGNYRYMDSWTINYYNYQGASVLNPTGLYNPLYGWETNKKFEAALELGFFEDRIYLSAAYFNNRSGNQLVEYSLPYQTGFANVVKNFPALVQNKGFEFQLTATPVKSKNFNWSFSANITLPSNKLLSFEGLNSSSYSFRYVEGESLNLIYKLRSLGVDPVTGLYTFEDADKDNTIRLLKDYQVRGNTDPRYYGGFRNTFTYKRFELNVFFDFKKQTGLNYLYSIYSVFRTPGFVSNQPAYILDRWQKPGDVKAIQKFTTIPYSDTYASKNTFVGSSDGVYSDASFLRLKTASIAWQLPPVLFKAMKTFDSKIFISAQNVFTISGYKGTDPEVQNYYELPVLRTIAVGINVNL